MVTAKKTNTNFNTTAYIEVQVTLKIILPETRGAFHLLEVAGQVASPQIKLLDYAKLRRLLITKVPSPQNKATLRRSMHFSVRKK